MEQKPMTKDDIEAFAQEATSDDEQELWEKKLLGNDPAHVAKSSFYKGTPDAGNIFIKIPVSTASKLKLLADNEGMRCEDYVLRLIDNHLKKN